MIGDVHHYYSYIPEARMQRFDLVALLHSHHHILILLENKMHYLTYIQLWLQYFVLYLVV